MKHLKTKARLKLLYLFCLLVKILRGGQVVEMRGHFITGHPNAITLKQV